MDDKILHYYHHLLSDLSATQVSSEDGGMLEQVFTQYAIDALTEAGETENSRVAFDEYRGRKDPHKINGYSIADNYETIDLFVTLFNGKTKPINVETDTIRECLESVLNFFKNAVYNDYSGKIEESSEIFDFAHQLASSKTVKEVLSRVNVFILTDGIHSNTFSGKRVISGYNVFFKVIDLRYLFSLSENISLPIEIKFNQYKNSIPCIHAPSFTKEYETYLTIIPADVLATVYEQYGSRLLEFNVRSFLQFNGKINQGIKNTILNEPEMFLAYNNGISATAEEIETERTEKGHFITFVRGLQIVNGGQTIASIYHTLKNMPQGEREKVNDLYVQAKISVIKKNENIKDIVSNISKYANTQNKVSNSDFTSNTPFHVELEKLSRTLSPNQKNEQLIQSKWFYERARGQYANSRTKEGFSKDRLKAFELKYPKNQLFNKEDLAKYLNSFEEIREGKKTIIGPHYVVRGNQKNYVQFVNSNTIKKPDSIYYENVIAKTILFRAAESVYGTKPNALGDMRYITVPYSISIINYHLGNKFNLYKIWCDQDISEELRDILKRVMIFVEKFIRSSAPGGLYSEWGKQEDCWNELKKADLKIDLNKLLKNDLINESKLSDQRIKDKKVTAKLEKEELERIKSIPPIIWRNIEDWGQQTKKLTEYEKSIAYRLSGRISNKSSISDNEREAGIRILEKAIQEAPELFKDIDGILLENDDDKIDLSSENLKRALEFDRKKKILRIDHHSLLKKIVEGKYKITAISEKSVKKIIKRLNDEGF